MSPFCSKHGKTRLKFSYMRKSITLSRHLISIKERIAKFGRLFSKYLIHNDLLKNICVIK